MEIRSPQTDADCAWVAEVWLAEWGGEVMVTRGRLHRLAEMQALIAWDEGGRAGLATYRLQDRDCELMSLNALTDGRGVGTALLAAVEEAARVAGCPRLWLITSNDNLDALRFYQRRGYRLVAVHPGAVDAAREVKPTIPLVGNYGIPLHDDLELAKNLAQG